MTLQSSAYMLHGFFDLNVSKQRNRHWFLRGSANDHDDVPDLLQCTGLYLSQIVQDFSCEHYEHS